MKTKITCWLIAVFVANGSFAENPMAKTEIQTLKDGASKVVGTSITSGGRTTFKDEQGRPVLATPALGLPEDYRSGNSQGQLLRISESSSGASFRTQSGQKLLIPSPSPSPSRPLIGSPQSQKTVNPPFRPMSPGSINNRSGNRPLFR